MIKTIEIRNFKAISRVKVKLTPLTAFIGYNGTGKSSIVEALETYKIIVTEGLNAGISQFRGFEHIYYKGKKETRQFEKEGVKFNYAPIEFIFEAIISNYKVQFSSSIAQEINGKKQVYFIEETYAGNNAGNYCHRLAEHIDTGLALEMKDKEKFLVPIGGGVVYAQADKSIRLQPNKSIIFNILGLIDYIDSWQFLSMNMFLMGNPQPQKKTGGAIILNKDGSNIAEYLLSIREANTQVFEGIMETMKYVLPYAEDIQPSITSELERMVYLSLSEQDFKVPGWLLSTGTLKLLALLAVFRNPNPSPLVVIEEIENGLDPRSIHLIVNEIREYVKDKNKQVIITTHSPYLLDLLHLSQIVFVERDENQVIFKRPYDSETLKTWAKDYKYTIGEMFTKELIQRFS